MDWIDVLYSDAIPWLMDSSDPSVRYWTLTKLLDRGDWEVEVVKARYAIMDHGPVVKILSHYASKGRWEDEKNYYTYKYTSAHWQLLLLAELAADGRDRRIAAACRRMIEDVHREDRPAVYPCFHGNLIGYLHALGHAVDDRVRLFETELAQAGQEGKWCCEINGGLPCAWGAARALWGLGHIPDHERSEAVKKAIESSIRFLGRFKLREGNYPSEGPRHKFWEQVSFPLFYQADILFTLRALANVGALQAKPTFGTAVTWLADQCREDNRWNCTSPFHNRMWAPLEASTRPSKWATWQALYVIKSASVHSR